MVLYNSEQQVVEMECRLLFSKFWNGVTMTRAQEKIGNTPGNHLLHRAGAFKLGLRAALDLKKPGPHAGVIDGVMLRCRSQSCSGYNEHMLYSFAGSRRYCPVCRYCYMQCVGCGDIREYIDPSCRSCKKRFI